MANIFWLVIALFLWGLLHSVTASLKAKALCKRFLGERSIRFYRLGYNVFAGLSFLPILGLLLLLPDEQIYAIPMPWVVLSLIAQILALLVLVVGVKQTGAVDFLGMNVLFGNATPDQHNLNTGGLYGYVRHPLYSAGLVFLWCSPAMTFNRLLVSACLSIYILIGAYFEERKLLIEYGETYREYRQKVPMLIPRLKGNK